MGRLQNSFIDRLTCESAFLLVLLFPALFHNLIAMILSGIVLKAYPLKDTKKGGKLQNIGVFDEDSGGVINVTIFDPPPSGIESKTDIKIKITKLGIYEPKEGSPRLDLAGELVTDDKPEEVKREEQKEAVPV